MKALGEALDLDYGTLTPLIKRLEAAGLVRRQRRTDDERAVDVHLTEAGRELRAKAAHIPDRIAQAMGLPDEQFARLQRDLGVLAGNLSRSLDA